MSVFIEIKPEEWKENPFYSIGKEWMLVTAQKDGKVNTMTAAWGGFGVMWGKNVAFVVIRPQRYTKEFIDTSNSFSLTFYEENYRKDLNYLGKVSGRDEDKVNKTGFHLLQDGVTPYFEECKTAFIVKKLFAQEYNPDRFLDQSIDEKWYPKKDYHMLYICEIEKILIKDQKN